uniref:Photosystem I reaction center subunit PsaK n=1 Tax=Dichotomaria marginata TaxID=268567 RepID=A0A1G4NSL5_9FLOR|nr:Photosystem I reaction center subunit X [Dichotomaria marginata]SCW21509.1 Photosystem I reaction center subunit X [Dichotomaria marginata]
MNTQTILALVNQNVGWSTKIALIMILCNILTIAAGRYAIQVRNLGTSISIAGLEEFGVTELLATTSLGHIIGAGTILGLKSTGFLI